MSELMTPTSPPPKRRYANVQDEIVDRIRRIETRFTKYLEFQGFDTQTARAQWVGGAVRVPSPAISLRDVLAAIPQTHSGVMVPVCVGDELIVTIHTPVK